MNNTRRRGLLNVMALALHEQADAAANDVAVGYAALDVQCRIEPTEHGSQGLQVVPHQRQASHRREVVVTLSKPLDFS